MKTKFVITCPKCEKTFDLEDECSGRHGDYPVYDYDGHFHAGGHLAIECPHCGHEEEYE